MDLRAEGNQRRVLQKWLARRRGPDGKNQNQMVPNFHRSQSAPENCAIDATGAKLCKCGCGKPVGPGRRSWHSQACVNEWLVRNSPVAARKQVFKRDGGRCAACGVNAIRAQARANVARTVISRPWRWTVASTWLDCRGRKHSWTSLIELRHRRAERFGNSLQARARLGAQKRLEKMRADGWNVSIRSSWWQADHIVPVQHGGGLCGLDNLQTLCSRCHRLKTAQQARQKAAMRRDAKSGGDELFSKTEPTCNLANHNDLQSIGK